MKKFLSAMIALALTSSFLMENFSNIGIDFHWMKVKAVSDSSAYANILNDFVKTHGVPENTPIDDFGNYKGTFCRLIDFNHDGIEELYLTGQEGYAYIVKIYALVDGSPKQVYQNQYFNPTSIDDFESIIHHTADNQYYIFDYRYDSNSTLHWYAFNGRSFEVKRQFILLNDQSIDTTGYTVIHALDDESLFDGIETYTENRNGKSQPYHYNYGFGSMWFPAHDANTVSADTYQKIVSVSNPSSPSNECGKNAYWSLEESTGTLTISGTGAMYDYGTKGYDDNYAPWLNQDTAIKKIIVQEGITKIGDIAFDGTAVESVQLPNSLQTIGMMAFHNCTKLKEITIPKSVTTIGDASLGEYGNSGENIVSGFKVYGVSGSVAESYVANVNSRNYIDYKITFVPIDSPQPPTELTAPTETQPPTTENIDENSNICGENASWTFDESSGTLTISGTGSVTKSTWMRGNGGKISVDEDGNSNVKRIVINEGITELHRDSSNNFGISLTEIILPSTLTYIDEWYFSYFGDVMLDSGFALRKVTIPPTVTTIGKNAFCSQFCGDGSIDTFYDNFVIRGNMASTAHTYANNNGIAFEAIDEDDFEEIEDVQKLAYEAYYIDVHSKSNHYQEELLYRNYGNAPKDNPLYQTSRLFSYDILFGALYTSFGLDSANEVFSLNIARIVDGFKGQYFDEATFFDIFLANLLANSFSEEELLPLMKQELIKEIEKYEKTYGKDGFQKYQEKIKENREEYNTLQNLMDVYGLTKDGSEHIFGTDKLKKLIESTNLSEFDELLSVMGNIFAVAGVVLKISDGIDEANFRKESLNELAIFYRAMLQASENTKRIFKYMHDNTKDEVLKKALDGYMPALERKTFEQNLNQVLSEQKKEIEKDAFWSTTSKIAGDVVYFILGKIPNPVTVSIIGAKLLISLEKDIYSKFIESDKLLFYCGMMIAANQLHTAMYDVYGYAFEQLQENPTFENAKFVHDTYDMYKLADIIAIPYIQEYVNLFISENMKYIQLNGLAMVELLDTIKDLYSDDTREAFTELFLLEMHLDDLKHTYEKNSCCMDEEEYTLMMKKGEEVFLQMFDTVKETSIDMLEWLKGKFDIHLIACPVEVRVYDENNTEIAILSNDGVKTAPQYLSYFHIMQEDNSEEIAKVLILPHESNLHYEIIGIDDGEMSLTSYLIDSVNQSNWFQTSNQNFSYDGLQVTNGKSYSVTWNGTQFDLIGDENEKMTSPEKSSSSIMIWIVVTVALLLLIFLVVILALSAKRKRLQPAWVREGKYLPEHDEQLEQEQERRSRATSIQRKRYQTRPSWTKHTHSSDTRPNNKHKRP